MTTCVDEWQAEARQASAKGATRRLLAGSTWNLVAICFTQGVTFASNVLIARILGRDVFGQYAVVQGSLNTAVGLIQTSMGGTTAKYVAEFRNTQPLRAAAILRLCRMFILLMACLGVIAVSLAAPWITTTVYRAPYLKFGFQAGVVFLFFSSLNSFQTGALSGFESYRSLGFASAASGIAILLVVAFGVLKYGLTGAFVALSAAALIRWLVHALALRTTLHQHGMSLHGISIRSAIPTVTRFALPSALCGYISLPSLWITQALLARQAGGFGLVGSYVAATNIRLIVLFLPQVINTVGISILNNHRHQVRAAYRLVHRSNVIAIVAANLIAASVAAVASGPLLSLFGKNFRGDSTVLWILLASTIPESISYGLHQHVQAQERMWQTLLAVNLPRELLVVSAAFLLIPGHGAVGLAVAYFLGTLLTLASCTILVRQPDPVLATT